MPMDAYVQIKGPDIKGDCQDAKHKDWVEVTNWNWGLTMPMTNARSSGGARTGGQVKPNAFTFMKDMDPTSPLLVKEMCKGTHFKEIVVHVMKSVGAGADDGAHKMVFCEYVFTGVVLEELTIDGGDDSPKETLKLQPATVSFKYTSADQESGAAKDPIPVSWNFIQNKP